MTQLKALQQLKVIYSFERLLPIAKESGISKDALTMAVVAAPKRAISESTDNWPMKVAKASNMSTR